MQQDTNSVIEALQNIKDILDNIDQYILPTIVKYLRDEVIQLADRIFKEEGIDPWVPLSEEYEQRKSKEYPNSTILRRTDALYGGYTDNNIDFSDYGILPHIEYSEYHEEGTGNIPARPVLGQIENYLDIDDAALTQKITSDVYDIIKNAIGIS